MGPQTVRAKETICMLCSSLNTWSLTLVVSANEAHECQLHYKIVFTAQYQVSRRLQQFEAKPQKTVVSEFKYTFLKKDASPMGNRASTQSEPSKKRAAKL